MGCRKVGSRSSLARIARAPDGRISWDWTWTAPGRGAYVCSTMECVERALRRGRLSRALRAEVDERSARELMEEFTAKVNDCGARERGASE